MGSNIPIFLDTEFTGLHQKTTLISIGLVSECGRRFYAEFSDYDRTQVNEWIQENVIDHLKFKEPSPGEDEYYLADRDIRNPMNNDLYKLYSVELRGDSKMIEEELRNWLKTFENKFGHKVEIWADVHAWDWILFCNLFGGPFELPKNILYIPFDIATGFRLAGMDPDVDRKTLVNAIYSHGKIGHNALDDAIITKQCFLKFFK